MSSRPITIAARMLAPLVAAVDASGHDARTLLARVHVDPSALDNVLARVPRDAVFAFVDDAVRTTGDPDLGVHAAELMVATTGTFGVLEYFTRSLPTARAGLALSTRYAHVLEDDAVFELVEGPEISSLTYRRRSSVVAPRAWNDLLVVSACLYVRRFVAVDGGTKVANRGLRFAHSRPSDLDELERLFDCAFTFDAEACASEFRADVLDGPIRTADPVLAGVLAPYATQILEAKPVVLGADDDPSMVSRVRAMLAEELESGTPTADHVAERLGTSARTLCRKLSAEGTSFQNVLDGLRHELALTYLRDPSIPIGDVAVRLGFSATSAFHHAFRRWTGRAPSDVRAAKPP